MKIRSITYFCNPGWPLNENVLCFAGKFLSEAKSAFETAGYEVQTLRLASVPFPQLLGQEKIHETPTLTKELTNALKTVGISYASLGPALPEMPDSYAIIPEAIKASNSVFFSGIMADAKRGICLPAVRACADVIIRTARLDPNGFANLNFAALANVKPGAPFFPAAYHDRHEPAFSLATQAADLAVQAFSEANTIEEGKITLVTEIERNARTLSAVAAELAHIRKIIFGGIDFSLAPFPEGSKSLGTAMEQFGVPKCGLHGSLAAAAILTEAIENADFPHTGFCGLMMPVLEDSILAKRAAEGTLSIKDLLLYSAVCGTGLDTIPLPGDTTREQIAAVLLDLSALALRLDKPLTARLMPIPGKKAGDRTDFDFSFFANSRVMTLEAGSLTGALNGQEIFPLKPR